MLNLISDSARWRHISVVLVAFYAVGIDGNSKGVTSIKTTSKQQQNSKSHKTKNYSNRIFCHTLSRRLQFESQICQPIQFILNLKKQRDIGQYAFLTKPTLSHLKGSFDFVCAYMKIFSGRQILINIVWYFLCIE